MEKAETQMSEKEVKSVVASEETSQVDVVVDNEMVNELKNEINKDFDVASQVEKQRQKLSKTVGQKRDDKIEDWNCRMMICQEILLNQETLVKDNVLTKND